MDSNKLAPLVKAPKKGDTTAVNNLFTACYQDVYYFVLKTVKNEDTAADVTQESMTRAFTSLHSLQDESAFSSWMMQIAYHEAMRHFRKKTEVLAEEDEDGNSVFDSLRESNAEFIPDEALNNAELKETIMKMVDALSPEQRSAVLLYYFGEHSVKEIALIQGVSEGTVKSRLNYSRKAIRASVEEYEKKYHVKLHGFPFFLFLHDFFSDEAKGTTPQIPKNISANQCVSTVNSVSSVAIEATGKTLAKASVSLITKMISGILATAVITGSAIAVQTVIGKNQNNSQTDSFAAFQNEEPGISSAEEDVFEKIDSEEAKEIQEAIKAYFNTVIFGQSDVYLSRLQSIEEGTLTYQDRYLTDEARREMLSVAPLSVWKNQWFANDENDTDGILENYLGLFHEYQFPYYPNTLGEKFTVSYQVLEIRHTSDEEQNSLQENYSRTYAIDGQELTDEYVKTLELQQQEVISVAKEGQLQDAYVIRVQYIADGSVKTIDSISDYTVAKINDTWYLLKNGYYALMWDFTLTKNMDTSRIP